MISFHKTLWSLPSDLIKSGLSEFEFVFPKEIILLIVSGESHLKFSHKEFSLKKDWYALVVIYYISFPEKVVLFQKEIQCAEI